MSVIVTGMDMPNQWDDCRFNYECECGLIDAVCSDEMSENGVDRPRFCPLKSIAIDGLLEKITQLPTQENAEGQDMFQAYDVIRAIREYCEVDE